MADNPRIEELRSRVQKDPASIAFAQLAEEYRRAGSFEEAIEVCRTGLEIHPGYLSVRVTLGRALIEVGDLDNAEAELHHVRDRAPQNLAAIRGLADIHHRRGNLNEALSLYQNALTLAQHDPDLEQVVEEISRTIEPVRAPATDGLSFEQSSAEFLSALEDRSVGESQAPQELPQEAAQVAAPGLPELEQFLETIQTYRLRRAV